MKLTTDKNNIEVKVVVFNLNFDIEARGPATYTGSDELTFILKADEVKADKDYFKEELYDMVLAEVEDYIEVDYNDYSEVVVSNLEFDYEIVEYKHSKK